MADEPVTGLPDDDEEKSPSPGIALCLSGGGYRAMVFHVGALWRLYEAGILEDVSRISSVSGGSITAGVLALAWSKLSFDPTRLKDDFVKHVVTPIREMAEETIDADSIITGLILPGRIGDRIAAAYDKHLFKGATLQELPDSPRFVINATSVQSGVLWRFSKPFMRDYRVGEVKAPKVPLAQAVAASSAFPPVLSPFELKLDPASFTPGSGDDLQRPPYTKRAILSDGGVYDNLGLETAWKRYDTILVSDAGGKIAPEEEPRNDWARHSLRVLELVDNQVRSLRKRQLIDSYKATAGSPTARKGTYWGIRTDISNYPGKQILSCPLDRTLKLAELKTRLQRMDDNLQERLINWGYAVCDMALRSHVNKALPEPTDFPYPAAKV